MRILQVEDNPGDARLIQEMIKESMPDVQLTQVDTLTQATSLLQEDSLDCILLDLGLPDSKGVDTYKKLVKQTNEVSVIILSGDHDESVAAEAIRFGAQDYLLKGAITSQLLKRTILYSIERKKNDLIQKKHRQELEKQVAARTDDLLAANKRLLMELGLAEASNAITQLLLKKDSTIADICHKVLDHVLKLTRSPHGYVGTVDSSSKSLICHTMTDAIQGDCSVDKKDIVFPCKQDGTYPGIWGDSLNTGQATYTNTPADHPARSGVPEGHIPIESYLAVPVLYDSELLGQIALANKPGGYTDQDLEQIKRIGATFAVAIDQSRTHVSLGTSELRMRKIIESSPIGIRITQLGKFVFVNQAYADIYGFDAPEELLGKNYLEMYPDEEHPLLMKRHKRRVEGDVTPSMYQAKGKKKSGEVIDVQIWLENIDYEGKPSILAFVVDITEKERLHKQLNQAIKMEALGTLAGGIAHDFNNILSAIMGFTELSQIDVQNPAKTESHLQQVMKATERAKSLVSQILSFSRDHDQERKPLQVSLIIKEALKLLRSSIPPFVEIHQDISDTETLVLADPTQIHQILMNLCTNAVHAMGDRGGILSVEMKRSNLPDQIFPGFDTLKPGPYLMITVTDSGQGIPPDILDKIFDPYFTTKKQDEGTGLGLSVVMGIVQKYDGSITVSSDFGRGTTFTIALPVIDSEVSADDVEQDTMRQGDATILYVDDETSLTDLAEKLLKHLGYRVDIENKPEVALERVAENPKYYDMVITDYAMPAMSGSDMAMKMWEIRPDLPIIMCTGFSERFSKEDAEALGFHGFVQKPPMLKELSAAIQKAQQKAKQTAEN